VLFLKGNPLINFAYIRKVDLPQPSPDDEMWTLDETAAFLRKSQRKLKDMRDQELIPKEILVGGRPMFLADEIQAWLRAGCPNQRRWMVLRIQEGF
jgi:hypothetical protein